MYVKKSTVGMTIGGDRVEWPEEALEEGFDYLPPSFRGELEIETYALSIERVLAALKARGVKTIQL